ncbi:hypothetical protein TSAR_009663 [Trichomalopsis sarcophagae]|uniref:PHD-type domain-containing protein n=1 Tax=Trichomalopsis sarcophagae TaxID=543379 RepID=A0A232ELS1_9HYME|nr:hypothetical protein TSAR_009663 [Trichomalopsis sarcophagae]
MTTNNLQINWSYEAFTIDKPLQKDAYNCGVFVMYYMDCIGNEKQFDMNFDPQVYRKEVAKLLIRESQCMKDVCLYCFSQRRTETIFCISCQRFAHVRCLLQGRAVNPTYTTSETCKLRATLCVKSFLRYINMSKDMTTNNLQINWSYEAFTIEKPLQKDAYNCGVFVYRKEVANLLIRESQCMKNVCLYCFSQRRTDTIFCISCQRFAHVRCLLQGRAVIPTDTTAETCKLCSQNEIR